MYRRESSKTINRKRCKPFLVLPWIVNEYFADKKEEQLKMPVKNPASLKLFTKRTNIKKREERPLTATLEKPMILDIKFIGLIDMSKVRKEFLNISNLCKMPLLINKKPVKIARPLSLPPAQKYKTKRKIDCDSNEGLDDNSNPRTSPPKAAAIRPAPTPAPIARPAKTSASANKKPTAIPHSPHRDANNNDNKPCKIAAIKPSRRQPAVPVAAKIEVGAAAKSAPSNVAEPCRTCGRKDQPERFHSHPATASAGPLCGKVASPRPAMKSTVQKPVAMKYKSKSSTNSPMEAKRLSSSRLPQPTPKPKPASQPPNPATRTKSPEPKRASSAKRTLTCYLCGREFGSASLPLHEPKCLQKWERENATLPAHLRRKVPPKPAPNISKDEWNKLAWETSQSTLMPCHNCGRTFYPERLIVHQRSCKTPQVTMKNIPSADAMSPQVVESTPSTPTSSRAPPTFECYICGKKFGSHSIKIHEKQCLKKWHIENDSLPVGMRSAPPVKKEKQKSPVPPPKESIEVKENSENRPSSPKKPPMFPCYICGRLFTVNSIYIHEPQCLKMWKIENEKLPASKRKPEPLKPDIKFTRDGKIDYEATTEAHWQSHLSQLIPCKICKRTFNPDRVEVHERSCKRI